MPFQKPVARPAFFVLVGYIASMSIPFRSALGRNVQFAIHANSPCPCGSAKSLAKCCLTPKGVFKLPSIVTPTPPKTGNSIEKCYAGALNDCGTKLSREHFVSKNLLEYLNSNGNLTIKGFHWQESDEQIVSPKSFAARILCERHNSSLSPLDSMALRLFKAFDESNSRATKSSVHLFSGNDLERWLLKTLCGVVFSKNLIKQELIELGSLLVWLEILFGHCEFPDSCGLYVCNQKGHRFAGPYGLDFRPIVEKRKIIGLGMRLCRHELILSMYGLPNRQFDRRSFVYRPFEFYFRKGDYERSVIFSWIGMSDGGTIISNMNSAL